MSLANGLSILFIFSKNQLLALWIFAMVSFISFSALIAVAKTSKTMLNSGESMDNVEEMDKFLKKYNFPKLNQDEI